MSLSPGDKLGPYEILAPLGAGGMGEVWKARDTRLGRLVAIKQLKGAHGARFEQEARAIAALNHPHICQIHDIGPDYLVLEYVEGKPFDRASAGGRGPEVGDRTPPENVGQQELDLNRSPETVRGMAAGQCGRAEPFPPSTSAGESPTGSGKNPTLWTITRLHFSIGC